MSNTGRHSSDDYLRYALLGYGTKSHDSGASHAKTGLFNASSWLPVVPDWLLLAVVLSDAAAVFISARDLSIRNHHMHPYFLSSVGNSNGVCVEILGYASPISEQLSS